MSSFHSSGEHLDYTPTEDTAAGSIRQVAGVAGIANVDLPADEVGALAIRGTVKVPNSGVAFIDGAIVGYDEAADEAVAAGGGDYDIGTSVGAAGTTDEVVVLLNARPTTDPV